MQNRGLSKTESDNSRILKVFTQSERLTVYEIAARTAVNYVSAKAHLQAHERSDILARVTFGRRIRYYRYKARAKRRRNYGLVTFILKTNDVGFPGPALEEQFIIICIAYMVLFERPVKA